MFKRQQKGVTLLEFILVLTIGSFVVLLGIQQYSLYKQFADEQQTLSNIGKLFKATSYYYRANCRNTSTLAPTAATAPTFPSNYVLNITTDLVNPKFLSGNIPITQVVRSTGGWDGYFVQLNRNNIISYVQSCSNPPACTTMTPEQIGTSVMWTIQVAVLLNDPTKASAYQNILGAKCLSSWSGTNVRPCSDNAPGDYLVFEQMPSGATNDIMPDLWVTNPGVELFTQSFTTNIVTRASHNPEYQYFVCGS